ncbi:hypothetical protein F5Y10DRAFT_233647 [Nemania abortiva]|nr:hypothetical protein F5Y10DRAFT_233647 [Nemania abortiva]
MSQQSSYSRNTQQASGYGSSGSSRPPPSQDPRTWGSQRSGALVPPPAHPPSPPLYGQAGSQGQTQATGADSSTRYPATAYSSTQSRQDESWKASSSGNRANEQEKDTRDEDKDKPRSAWERRAARLGGRDGGPATATRETQPLPRWLRKP